MTLRHVSEEKLVDADQGVVIRRVEVGPLATNCYAVHAVGSSRCLLVDPGGDAAHILHAYGDLDVALIVLTHAHWDHVEALAEVVDALGVPVAAHPAEEPVWQRELAHLTEHGHWDAGTATAALLATGCNLRPHVGAPRWDGQVSRHVRHGTTLTVDGLAVGVIHTPEHTAGGICLSLPGHILTGDTLFPGGPGLTGWPLSDFDTIIDSIRDRLFVLPGRTVVHPGHGPATTIGREAPYLARWVQRRW